MPFEVFPYTNFHELNLDWIVKVCKEVEEKTDAIDDSVEQAAAYAGASDAAARSAANHEAGAEGYKNTCQQIASELLINYGPIKNQVNVNSARIDEFTHLAEGSTTGDAELIDIRVGAEGSTYATAGDAVRKQIVNRRSTDVKIVDALSENKIPFLLTWTYASVNDSGVVTTGDTSRVMCNEFIPSEYFYDVKIDRTVRPYYTWLVYYDANYNFISRVGIGATDSPTIDQTKAYYKLLVVDYTNNQWTNPQILTNVDNDIKVTGVNPSLPHIFKVEKNGTGDFSSLVAAIREATKYMDSIVYVGNGNWDLIDELGSTYINNVSSSQRGLVLKNRIHLIFSSNSIVRCEYLGTRDATKEWLSAFNAGEYGFTLENANIVTANIRYCVHDERDQDTDAYVNKYINCNMYHNSSYEIGGQYQCIGGGLGKNGYIDISNCIFANPNANNNSLVSYHNSLIADAKSNINISGCYVKGTNTIRLSWYGNSTLMTTAKCHDNSLGLDIVFRAETLTSPNENIELLSWNNSIHN